MLLSIVIPSFDEEEVIYKTFKWIINFKEELKDLKLEIIFFDDGGRDKTPTILNKLVGNNDFVKTIFLI